MSDHNSLLFKQKQALRQKMLAWRKSLSASELAEISLKAQMHVLALPQWQGATQVLLYYPVNNELDTMLLIESAFEQKKEVLLPRCIAGQKGQMELAHCPDLSCLVLGQFGIMEPNPKTCPAFYPDSSGDTCGDTCGDISSDISGDISSDISGDICVPPKLAVNAQCAGATNRALVAGFISPKIAILPGLAFCPCGLRLGYGGGYYDRFLNENKINNFFLLGFGASFQVQEELPQGKWDYPLNAICTEKGVVRCSRTVLGNNNY